MRLYGGPVGHCTFRNNWDHGCFGLYNLLRSVPSLTLLRPLGRIRPTRIHLGIPPDFAASPAHFGWPAGQCTQQTHCDMHASIFFLHTQMTTPAVWFMSESGAVAIEQARI